MRQTVPITNDVFDIPVDEMFASADWRVIARKGEYYYKSCGAVVLEKSGGGATHCVKPIHHPSSEHEDFEGRTLFGTFAPETIEDRDRQDLKRTLKAVGLEPEQAYNVINAMTAEGFRVVREGS